MATVAVLADHLSGVVDVGWAHVAAEVATVLGWCPAARAERGAVVEPGHRHPQATALAALFDNLRIGAVAGETDSALGATGGDSGVAAPASSAVAQTGPNRAHLTHTSSRSDPWQIDDLPAPRTPWPHYLLVPGTVENVGQADLADHFAAHPGALSSGDPNCPAVRCGIRSSPTSSTSDLWEDQP
jgi:hypothetical protein